jgi:hypothetical protein
MSIRFGFDMGPSDDDIVVSPAPGEITWDEVLGDGYVEGDDDEGYA